MSHEKKKGREQKPLGSPTITQNIALEKAPIDGALRTCEPYLSQRIIDTVSKNAQTAPNINLAGGDITFEILNGDVSIFQYDSLNNRLQIGGLKALPPEPDMAHYFLKPYTRDELFYIRKHYGNLSVDYKDVLTTKYTRIPDNLLVYLMFESSVPRKRIDKVTIVNFGESTELGLKVGADIYVSEGIGDSWHNIRGYATIFNAGGKM